MSPKDPRWEKLRSVQGKDPASEESDLESTGYYPISLSPTRQDDKSL